MAGDSCPTRGAAVGSAADGDEAGAGVDGGGAGRGTGEVAAGGAERALSEPGTGGRGTQSPAGAARPLLPAPVPQVEHHIRGIAIKPPPPDGQTESHLVLTPCGGA